MISKYKSLIIIVLISTIFSMFLYYDVLMQSNYILEDLFYQSNRSVPPEVVIVAIDDESLGYLGQWPWPRTVHGELLKTIDSGFPKAIGVDVLFLEPSEDDEDFASQLASLTKKPIFASYGQLAEAYSEGKIVPLQQFYPPDTLLPYVDLAHINTIPDADGMVRSALITLGTDPELESLSAALYRKAYEKAPYLPLDPFYRLPIRFAGKSSTFEMIPYHMVYTGEVDPEYFKDKIVIIGVTAIGLADDYYFTPIDRTYPMYGVEVHANVIMQYIQNIGFKRPSIYLEILALIITTTIGYFLLSQKKILRAIISFIVFVGLYLLVISNLGKLQLAYIFRILYPLLSLLAVFIVSMLIRYISEALERNRVTKVFGRYMEPRLVKKLLEGGEAAFLGGQKKFITVLFVDVRGFTTMSEALEPEEVVAILNEYLDLCSRAIFKFDGTLDKYIGDAAMALFGAPLEIESHALSAVKTALYMKEESLLLAKVLEERYGKSVNFGIGINTGCAVVGNIGSKKRLDYTAIGDAVNTAARLESNAKPSQILISDATYSEVKDHVNVEPLGEISVKGKVNKIKIYEVLSLK